MTSKLWKQNIFETG